MSRILIGLLLTCMATVLQADDIDAYVQTEMARQHIPGVALAIIRGGDLERARGYGWANLEHQVPVNAETIFQSGSIGKQFTGVAAMLLVEDGKLALDKSLRHYWPQAPKAWSHITPRHLLNHTSGLHRGTGLDLRRDYSDEEMLQLIFKVKQDFPVGERWEYSNTGYVLLGLLIRKVSGEFYGDILARRVFAPLSMHTARVISDRDVVMNRAAGYEVQEDGATLNQKWVAPTGNSTADGSLYLTVLDYVKWNAGLRAGKILKPESWAEVYRPAKLNNGTTYPYGFGWFLETAAGQQVRYHSGGWQGFSTFLIRYLGDDLAIVVLANSNRANAKAMARGVAGLLDPKLASIPAPSP